MATFCRYITVFSLLIIFSTIGVSAQDTIKAAPKQKNHNILDRMDFGGYLGAQFGDVTAVNISPLASYRVTNAFYVGLGFTYQYFKDNRYSPGYNSNSYGGNLFLRYFIWRDLFAHVEYAPLYINYYDYFDDGSGGYYKVKNSTWVQDLMIGGGYRQWIGDRASVNIMVLWNVNESYYSPYRNPIIRIGFGVGL
jgi:hypothetical protein